MHTLVAMQQLTRKEFLRALKGVPDGDARRRVGPMNCISWTVGHMASQEHAYFVAGPRGSRMDEEHLAFATGRPASQPPLEDALALWHSTCDAADVWLCAATEEDMLQVFDSPGLRRLGENAGTLLVRNIFHYWSHIGEISAIRQVLGHRAPEFVDMHGWSYEGR
ncbi:MAG: DinB family protein [Chloroflexi bacterium]|nr:DinB family protein [Chloroflexota bacterium]